MKKRILCLLLVLAMMLGICGMLASCGGGDDLEGVDRNEDEFDDDDKGVSKYYEYVWGKTTLNIELSENTVVGELISGVRRYLSGEDDRYEDPLDDNIKYRNEQAKKVTRVETNYSYLPDVKQYTWAANVSRMARESQAYSDQSADIYVNFIFDMVGASLQGAFANLKSTTMYGTDKYAHPNYFEFNDPSYNAIVDDKGYMYDLMHSLSFSTKKMYVLASDYLTDVVRAFFVVPVNISMINAIAPEVVGDYNYIDDGKFDINDFFEIIWRYKWDYDAVKTLSLAVASQVGDEPDLDEDTYGFILGTESGIHGVGILYGTDVVVIERTLDESTGLYRVSYPETCQAYADFTAALADLFSSEGVGVKGGKSDVETNTSAYAMRQSFKEGRLLFGGVICAGNLENQDYQDMNAVEDGGFGVAPVPMYRPYDESRDVIQLDENTKKNTYYRTASHNIAKCAAISVATTKYIQCSAWLDYQSTHSTEILNEYYETELQYGIAGNNDNNVKVLGMLRDNVSTALDKCYDDAIYVYDVKPNPNLKDVRWCAIIRQNKYQLANSRTEYTNAVAVKTDALQRIYKKYENLPD